MSTTVHGNNSHVAASICAFLQRELDSCQDDAKKASLQASIDCLRQVYVFSQQQQDNSPDLVALVPKPTEEVNVDAEALEWKNKGNDLMRTKDYEEAYAAYTEAIRLKEDAVFYGNRAAACISMEKYELAVEDATRSKAINPKYAKSYARLRHALKALGRHSEALQAYSEASALDPSNSTYAGAVKELKTLNEPVVEHPDDDTEDGINNNSSSDKNKGSNNDGDGSDDTEDPDTINTSSSSQQQQQPPNPFASMFGGNGGNNPLGGMDLNALLSNPAVMNMAQSFMSNPAMANMFAGMGQQGDDNTEQ